MKPHNPSENHFIEDNFEAAVLIAAQGQDMLDKLTPAPGCNSAHHPYETQHHWCLAGFHCGHELDKDNGYSVAMFSKVLCSKGEAMVIFADAIAQTTEGNIYVTML